MNTKSEILSMLQLLTEDLEMLREGEWQPDRDSCDASIDNLDSIVYKINNL